jgi:hypothetical protein
MFENTLFDHFVHVLLVEKERKEGGKEERKEERIVRGGEGRDRSVFVRRTPVT